MKLFFLCAMSMLLLVPVAGAESGSTKKLTPQTQNGVELVSGGVGGREQAALDKMDEKYNVRVTISNSRGAYLSGVDLSIETDAGKRLVEHTLRGPILLAKLDSGRYVLQARGEGRMTERRVFDVPKDPKDQVRIFITLAKKAAE
ncbi:MAG TPA: hypothetical protein VLS88_09215 [Polyangiales bacterium]|nr:hypothetical protein [Polyangiales bacterium]